MDGEALLRMTCTELTNLGVEHPIHNRRIMRKIHELSETKDPDTSGLSNGISSNPNVSELLLLIYELRASNKALEDCVLALELELSQLQDRKQKRHGSVVGPAGRTLFTSKSEKLKLDSPPSPPKSPSRTSVTPASRLAQFRRGARAIIDSKNKARETLKHTNEILQQTFANSGADNIHTLRALLQADQLHKSLRRGSRIIIDPRRQASVGKLLGINNFECETQKELIQKPRYVLLPDHPLRIAWDSVLMTLVVYYGLSVPFFLAFEDAEPDTVAWNVIEIGFNILFIIDIILNFLTSYKINKGAHKGEMQLQVVPICKHYLFGWFLLDFAASVPVDLMMGGGNLPSFNKLFRLIRGFKLMRLLRMTRILRRIQESSASNAQIVRMIKLILSLVFMWHWIGCFYWFISFVEGFGTSRWTPGVIEGASPVHQRYFLAFYWAVTVTTGVGRDIYPETGIEVWYSVVSIVVGVIMYAFIVGSASSALSNFDTIDKARMVRMEQLSDFLRDRRVPITLQRDIQDYYEFMYSIYQRGDKDSLLSNLHSGLKHELNVAVNSRLISEVPCFQAISLECQSDLVSKLVSQIYLPNEYIVLLGDKAKVMYFLMNGRLEVLNADKVAVRLLFPGSFFGELALWASDRRSMSVRSITFSECMSLSKTDFRYMLKQHPSLALYMQRHAPTSKQLTGWPLVRFLLHLVQMNHALGGKESFGGLLETLSAGHVVQVSRRTSVKRIGMMKTAFNMHGSEDVEPKRPSYCQIEAKSSLTPSPPNGLPEPATLSSSSNMRSPSLISNMRSPRRIAPSPRVLPRIRVTKPPVVKVVSHTYSSASTRTLSNASSPDASTPPEPTFAEQPLAHPRNTEEADAAATTTTATASSPLSPRRATAALSMSPEQASAACLASPIFPRQATTAMSVSPRYAASGWAVSSVSPRQATTAFSVSPLSPQQAAATSTASPLPPGHLEERSRRADQATPPLLEAEEPTAAPPVADLGVSQTPHLLLPSPDFMVETNAFSQSLPPRITGGFERSASLPPLKHIPPLRPMKSLPCDPTCLE